VPPRTHLRPFNSRRKKESGTDSYRELLDQTESLEEFYGHRVQTPLIFEKTLQLPPRLPGLAQTTLMNQTGQNAKLLEGNHLSTVSNQQSGYRPTEKVLAGPKRTVLPMATRDEASLIDYDFGLCTNQIEL